MDFFHLLKNDFYRTFVSKRFFFAILGVFSVMGVTRMQMEYIYDALYAFQGIHIRSMVLLTFIFCAYPSIAVFFDELKNRYWISVIIRSNVGMYSVSKILVCIVSSIVIMCCGKGSYLVFLSIRYPLVDTTGGLFNQLISWQSFKTLNQGHFGMFFFLAIGTTAMLAAVLSLCSMLCILLIKTNCIMAISIPAVLFYFLNTYLIVVLHLPERFNLASVFSVYYNVMENDILSFFYALQIMSIACILLGIAVTKVIVKKVRNGEF